jgi:hypothetical protein
LKSEIEKKFKSDSASKKIKRITPDIHYGQLTLAHRKMYKLEGLKQISQGKIAVV